MNRHARRKAKKLEARAATYETPSQVVTTTVEHEGGYLMRTSVRLPPVTSDRKKHRPASKRALQALDLHTRLSARYYYRRETGEEEMDCTAMLNGDVNIPVSLKLIEKVRDYLWQDCPKSMWQLPDFRAHDKAYREAEEEKLTPDQLAEQRGIKLESADKRIQRRK
jgi:hypothetical protein